MIEVLNLGKTFHDRKKGDIPAVRDISFSCSPGRIFGLLGRNGAGKTTTLRMLATILVPTSGTARIEGFDVNERAGDVRKRIGYLSGDTKLYDRLTGRELLEYFGELAGMTPAAIASRIPELQESFGLGEFLEKRVGKMSTGMKQRLSLARVVLHDPPVLIFDEPTSGLDVMGAREVLRIVRDLSAKGRTVIFSTHIMTEAERICDEIAIIEKGSILAQGTVDSLKRENGGGSLEDVFVKTVGEVNGDA
ncbi:MAG: ABC transporter ATP-binding protein [Candidatus Eisenbacteria bacterium]|uniref:ABC transporter ATP-binding protein n=1 Tax=Eiseniibacteriota bacterium TaxID=2212470 RepID=A0A538T482_UNCEI|nr:MAG: ABC transporter ATP-binding protein [Candidatus Eisenbacteria bacterium]